MVGENTLCTSYNAYQLHDSVRLLLTKTSHNTPKNQITTPETQPNPTNKPQTHNSKLQNLQQGSTHDSSCGRREEIYRNRRTQAKRYKERTWQNAVMGGNTSCTSYKSYQLHDSGRLLLTKTSLTPPKPTPSTNHKPLPYSLTYKQLQTQQQTKTSNKAQPMIPHAAGGYRASDLSGRSGYLSRDMIKWNREKQSTTYDVRPRPVRSGAHKEP